MHACVWCRGTGSALNGCINDAQCMMFLLKSRFQFQDSDFRVLTDDQNSSSQWPTRANIFEGFRWLAADARPGDSLVFHFSGTHGHCGIRLLCVDGGIRGGGGNRSGVWGRGGSRVKAVLGSCSNFAEEKAFQWGLVSEVRVKAGVGWYRGEHLCGCKSKYRTGWYMVCQAVHYSPACCSLCSHCAATCPLAYVTVAH